MQASWNEGYKTYVASEDMAAYRRVKLLNDGTIAYADQVDQGIGVIAVAVTAGDTVTVKGFNDPGTMLIESNTALAIAGDAIADDDGRIAELPIAPGTYWKIGIAEEAATAQGDVVEIRPIFAAEAITVT